MPDLTPEYLRELADQVNDLGAETEFEADTIADTIHALRAAADRLEADQQVIKLWEDYYDKAHGDPGRDADPAPQED